MHQSSHSTPTFAIVLSFDHNIDGFHRKHCPATTNSDGRLLFSRILWNIWNRFFKAPAIAEEGGSVAEENAFIGTPKFAILGSPMFRRKRTILGTTCDPSRGNASRCSKGRICQAGFCVLAGFFLPLFISHFKISIRNAIPWPVFITYK